LHSGTELQGLAARPRTLASRPRTRKLSLRTPYRQGQSQGLTSLVASTALAMQALWRAVKMEWKYYAQ